MKSKLTKQPRCKKEVAKCLKRPCWKRCEITWEAKVSCFDRYKVLVMMTSLENLVISGAQSLPDVDGIKILIKMNWPQITVFYLNVFCALVIFIKNVDPINIWRPEITIFCRGHQDQNFYTYQKQGDWPPIWFHIYFNKAFYFIEFKLCSMEMCSTCHVFLIMEMYRTHQIGYPKGMCDVKNVHEMWSFPQFKET